jgi:hypothetical protein
MNADGKAGVTLQFYTLKSLQQKSFADLVPITVEEGPISVVPDVIYTSRCQHSDC